ncbi:Dabb family protein [Nocardia caishijiensis]|uniref:Stress responsive alpha/beta barrel protein n=1 Tax=Nocardia caishijiensis TaxID=184756 RepID=A0ABQ6YHI0_9NOCA|nr:Dabb family protein [Nocardia caishijiensis]KAF0844954.1 stress responsive alpha/beta barrel protein [Nocardia caishijiensis]
MSDVVRLLHLTPTADTDRVLAELRATALASPARRVLVQPTLPGVRNGGDILVHLRFDDATAWNTVASQWESAVPGIARVDGAEYGAGVGGTEPPTGSVYRVLLLRVSPDAAAETTDRFEADLLRMPRYISTIRSWRLSRTTRALGSAPWTHVWEQEFTDLDGLDGPYLMHPVHWAHVDRWFDPEHPEVIVRDRICHSFCLNEPLRG